jgi:FixJ family two-component response regulator
MTAPLISKKSLVALVDDHELFRKATARVLEAKGFETKAFGSVAEFVRAGILSRIHCLVLDVSMPEINGIALQQCLRQTNHELPIVFCSGTEDEAVRAKAIAGGASSFLRKPVSPQQLIDAIAGAVARSAAQSHAHR